jgi:Double zinc ribbon
MLQCATRKGVQSTGVRTRRDSVEAVPRCTGHVTQASRLFCTACVPALARVCLQCGTHNAPTARFCGECGQAVTVPTASGPAVRPLPVASVPALAEAERRQLTVLCCDLVDSTHLARQLDPEDWRDIVRAFQQTCATTMP